ncbi:hypothetical protein OR16_12775 [Cupriavidus basilensis OR16]|uniref:DUF1214 domain-containing protein n=1 Tax=Cupriavidus basilensis OR16 TaxID=1127483 RepID=H1S471_9BURK|nr:hypothetical protein [Cupriavidus basilensis]EHP42710.1 hypothetical protein OR16_12775 [Cupriavidus basilensis OR16]
MHLRRRPVHGGRRPFAAGRHALRWRTYTLNNLTAKTGGDGAITVQFGGCEAQAANSLPIVPGWNYTVRLYRPRAEILSGAWTFPEPQPVN